MPFIASDKPMKKGGLAHRTGRKRCTGIGKLPRKNITWQSEDSKS